MARMTCCCDGDERLRPQAGAGIAARDAPPGCAFTVGHATRPIDAFTALVAAHGVTLLVDVRTVPHSRHHPQFDAQAPARSRARRACSRTA